MHPEYLAVDGLGNLYEAEEMLGKFKLKKLLKKSAFPVGKLKKKKGRGRARAVITGGLFGLGFQAKVTRATTMLPQRPVFVRGPRYNVSRPARYFSGIREPQPAFVLGEYVYGDLGSLGKLKLFKKLGKAVKKVGKGVKKVVKSDAFKKLAVIGGVVAAGMFLGPMAAGAVKKVGSKIAAKRAVKYSSPNPGEVIPAGDTEPGTAMQVVSNITGLLGTAATIKAMQAGAIPTPPTSIGSQNYTEWATSAGMSAMEIDAQRRLTPQERAYAESRIRSEVEALQAEATGKAPGINPTLLLGGGALLAVILLTR
jgi:hypothetical protein